MADRQGIEIDYCPQCRGVWLDRGELDKIIERTYAAPAGYAPPAGAVGVAAHPPPPDPRYRRDDYDDDYDDRRRPHKRRRRGWLDDIFDID